MKNMFSQIGSRSRVARMQTGRRATLESLETRALLTADIVISELMASNTTTLADSQGQYHDWIELHNRGDVAVDLENWLIRDRSSHFRLPKVTIGVDDYMVLFASGSARVVEDPFEIHTNFRLAKGGEYLAISDPAGTVVNEFNPFPPQEDDVSYGLSHNDVYPQYFPEPTPGTRNASAPNVYISEFMAINQNNITDEDGDYADWIEIHNAGDSPANLQGWKLIDSSADWEFQESVIPPNGYLVVFASGNDRSDPASELHTNFKLGGDGDSLRLVRPDGNFTSHFRRYPTQSTDVSYGVPNAIAEPQYFHVPTPGTSNVVGEDVVRFSHSSGFYNAPISITLGTENPDSQIRYTIDGSKPTNESMLYERPIAVTESSVVQAAVFHLGQPEKVTSRSFLIKPSILQQSGVGRPETWGVAADYDMDPQVIANGFSGQAFDNVAAISIIVEPDDLFSIADGLFAHPLMEGPEWQRPVLVEVIGDYRTRSTAAIAGSLKTTGVHGERNPALTSKYSMEIQFDQRQSQVDSNQPLLNTQRSLDGLVLRAGHADSWLADSDENRSDATYSRDSYLLQTQRDMGQLSLASQSFNVFINGLYWGAYTVTESPTQHTFAEQIGGSASNFDVVGQGGLLAGDPSAWDRLLRLANEDLRQPDAYSAVASLVDIENLMDFELLQRYAEIGDALEESWVAGRDQAGTNGFKFVMYSNERSFGIEPTPNSDGPLNAPSFLFDRLAQNERFRQEFADRANKHLTSGALNPNASSSRWLNQQINLDMVSAESARWGDYRRDANPQGGNAELYGVSHFHAAKQNGSKYIFDRTEALKTELQADGLLAKVAPPTFTSPRFVVAGSRFTITTPSGELYYTLDGSDPRGGDGQPSPSAERYTTSIVIEKSQRIRARALDGGEWSAVTETVVQILGESPLHITEIMYHPAPPPEGSPYDDDDFEFIELQNTGDSPITLAGHSFNRGIKFDFNNGGLQTLAPGQLMLVVKNKNAFESRYDANGLFIAGEFQGQLNNGGDSVRLVGEFGEYVAGRQYSDLAFKLTDGIGFSLEYDAESPWSAPSISSVIHGTPGFLADSLPVGSLVISEILASGSDPDGDWIELHNRTDEPIDIGGWYVSDSSEDLRRFEIAPGTIIGPGQYYVLTEMTHFGNAANPNSKVKFSLSAGGESIYISSVDEEGRLAGYREQAEYGATQLNASMGRIDKEDGTFEYAPLRSTTKGTANAEPAVGPVVISEIMHSPVLHLNPAVNVKNQVLNVGEFLEIHNITDRPVPLYDIHNPKATWRFSEGIEYVFPENQILPADGRALIVGMDPEIFRERANLLPGDLVYGPFLGVLRNEGEAIALTQATSSNAEVGTMFTVVDRVEYNDTAPWPGIAKSGSSLERRVVDGYANDSANWMPSRFGGSPGRANVGVDERRQSIPYFEDFEVNTIGDIAGWQFTSASNSQWLLQRDGRNRSKIVSYVEEQCQFCDSTERESTATIALDIDRDESLAAILEIDYTNVGTGIQISEDGHKWITILTSNNALYGDVGINLTDEFTERDISTIGTRYLRISGFSTGLGGLSIVPGDIVGPSIVQHHFNVGASLESITLTFNEEIERLTTRDLVLTNPLGQRIVPEVIETNDNVTWTVRLPHQAISGTYRFTVLGSITDSAGNPFNMDGYSINGRSPNQGVYRGDVYVDPAGRATFSYDVDFDDIQFENLTAWAFDASQDSSWQLIDDPNRPGGQIKLSGSGAFRIATDLTNRVEEDVTLDFWAKAESQRLSWLSIQVVSEEFPSQFIASAAIGGGAYRHFALDIDETLDNIGFDRSRPFDIVIWGNRGIVFDDIRISDDDAFGPRVDRSTHGEFDGPVSNLSLAFNEPVDIASLISGLEIADPMGTPIPITSVRREGDTYTYLVDFEPQSLAGQYRFVVRESVMDVAGNPMNQFRNFFAGESSDSFIGTFSVRSQPTKTFPYRQTFEDGIESLDGWSFAIHDGGTWELGPNDGLGGVTGLHTNGGRGGIHEAILSIDLSDRVNDDVLSLTFLARSNFGRADGALSVSGDGNQWRYISPIRIEDRYVAHSIDLRAHLAAAGIALDDNAKIKFEFRQAGSQVFLDDVEISNRQVIGARIVDQSAVMLDGDAASVNVRFDQAIEPASFTAADATLTLIDTLLPAEQVTQIDEHNFTITFQRPKSAGVYEIKVGPGILNLDGIPMNQSNDAFNGVSDDSYAGNVIIPLESQTIPYTQDFSIGEVTDLSGWLFQTVNQQGNFGGGRWDVSSAMEPFGDFHLRATQFSDCWSEHDGILALDYSDFVDNTDMVLEFNMRRTTTNGRKGQGGERNLGQLLIGESLHSFVQVGKPESNRYFDGKERFEDLNLDGVIDLVPRFDDYVFYRFDLDEMIQRSRLDIGETLYINFHRIAFFNTDVTLFDNIQVYSEAEHDVAPRVISSELSRFARPNGVVESATFTFNERVTGFDLADVQLTRNGGPNLLGEHNAIIETEPGSFTISGLRQIANLPGDYELSLFGPGSGIEDADGHAFTDKHLRKWSDTRRPGDANLDGLFDTSDFIQVFRFAQYEDDVAGNSTWESGDWNGDFEFTSSDFVVAFSAGFYEKPAALQNAYAANLNLDISHYRVDDLFSRDAAIAGAIDVEDDVKDHRKLTGKERYHLSARRY